MMNLGVPLQPSTICNPPSVWDMLNFGFGAEIRSSCGNFSVAIEHSFYGVLQVTVCRLHWNGCIKVPWCCGRECSFTVFFASGPRKSYWSGCIKVAMVFLWTVFSLFGPDNFTFSNSVWKTFQKFVIFLVWHRDSVLEQQFLLEFCT